MCLEDIQFTFISYGILLVRWSKAAQSLAQKNRCITVHSTDNAIIEDNACFDIIGHAFFLENAVEVGNKFYRNLGMLVHKGKLLPSDTQPTTFWITNANNTLQGNIASGSANTCFWYLANISPLNENADMDRKPYLAPFGVFQNNVGHTCRVGLRFDEGISPITDDFTVGSLNPFSLGVQTSSRVPILISDSLFHHAYDMGIWIRLDNDVDFTCLNCIVADNRLGIRYGSHQKLRNSLVVGQSNNALCSKDFYWHYDGTSTMPALCKKGVGLHLILISCILQISTGLK
jgi:hypothetical protein